MKARFRDHENPFAKLSYTDASLTPIMGRTPEGVRILSLLGKYLYPTRPTDNTRINKGTQVRMQPNDLCPWKPGSQVIVTAGACAPAGKLVREMEVEIRSPQIQHRIRVFGPRQTIRRQMGVHFSAPREFSRIPLELGYAFGGTCQGRSFPPNPLGTGFHLQATLSELLHKPLPCLENPDHLLEPAHLGSFTWKEWKHLPIPSHSCFIPGQFYPRQSGSIGEKPSPSSAFSSHANLTTSAPMALGSVFTLAGIHPTHATVEVSMPESAPVVWMQFENQAHSSPMSIQDVHINPDANRLAVVWRASFPLPAGCNFENATRLQFGMIPESDT